MRHVCLFSILLMAGCGTAPIFSAEQEKAVVEACMEEVQAPGTYSISPGRPSANPEGALPRASAVVRLGGTSAGAAEINACIQRSAAI